MINLTIDQIKQKIVEEKQISQEELDEKIKAKLEELSGLISQEGAAHIIANELGVNLMKTGQGLVKIGSLLPGMKDVEVAGRVIRKYEVRAFKTEHGEGKVAKFLLGDDSGITMITLWNDKADWLSNIEEQDIVKLSKLNIRDNNGRSEAHAGEGSKIEKNPEGIEIKNSPAAQQSGEVTRKKISELKENDSNVEIFVTIVQVFDPRFFEPRNEEEKGNAVLNLFIDDGSDNIRCVFWKESMMKLLNTDEAKLNTYKESPEKFEEVKSDLLGKMVKLIGRVNQNKVLGRLEFVANKVTLDVDPDKEVGELEKEKSATENDSKPVKEEPKPSEEEHEVNEEEKKKKENVSAQTPEDLDDLEEEVLNLEDLDDL